MSQCSQTVRAEQIYSSQQPSQAGALLTPSYEMRKLKAEEMSNLPVVIRLASGGTKMLSLGPHSSQLTPQPPLLTPWLFWLKSCQLMLLLLPSSLRGGKLRSFLQESSSTSMPGLALTILSLGQGSLLCPRSPPSGLLPFLALVLAALEDGVV